MINNLYMLFDTISGLFVGSLSIIINDAVAIRSFTELMHEPNFPFRRMAKDIKLYRLGSINSETGAIEFKKEFVCNLSDLIVFNSDEKKE